MFLKEKYIGAVDLVHAKVVLPTIVSRGCEMVLEII